MMQELERDPALRGLAAEEKQRILQEAVAFGTAVANAVRQEYGVPENAAEMAALAGQAGAVVRMDRQKSGSGTLAEYDEATREIFCYRDEVEKMERRIADIMAERCGAYDLLSLAIAHELFHHLENTRFGKADKQISREVVWLGLFRTRKPVALSREIAAHAFVKRFLDLPDYPVFS